MALDGGDKDGDKDGESPASEASRNKGERRERAAETGLHPQLPFSSEQGHFQPSADLPGSSAVPIKTSSSLPII